MTRARISIWLRLGSPPLNMFHSPMNRITATTRQAMTVTRVTMGSMRGSLSGWTGDSRNIGAEAGREAVIDRTNSRAEEQFPVRGQPHLERRRDDHRQELAHA